MTWIGLTDHNTALFDQAGIAQAGSRPLRKFGAEELLPRGALMLETDAPVQGAGRQILGYHHHHPWERGFDLRLTPNGSLAMTLIQGGRAILAALHHGMSGDNNRLRITYHWDAPQRRGWLALHRLGTTQHYLEPVIAPTPLCLGDVQDFFRAPLGKQCAASVVDENLTYLALSDQPFVVGPMPSIAPDTPVLTVRGYQSIATLERGDLIVTPEGDQVPVLANISVTAPARGGGRPIRLRAPYFGLRQDITVSCEQRLCVSGPEIEFLFGTSGALVPVQHLVDGVAAFHVRSAPLATWHQLLLPKNEPMIAAGAAVQSLYIGRMRRRPDQIAQSLLADFDRSRLPEHGRQAFPVLKPFEAATLAQQRIV